MPGLVLYLHVTWETLEKVRPSLPSPPVAMISSSRREAPSAVRGRGRPAARRGSVCPSPRLESWEPPRRNRACRRPRVPAAASLDWASATPSRCAPDLHGSTGSASAIERHYEINPPKGIKIKRRQVLGPDQARADPTLLPARTAAFPRGRGDR